LPYPAIEHKHKMNMRFALPLLLSLFLLSAPTCFSMRQKQQKPRFNANAIDHLQSDFRIQALEHPAWKAANDASALLKEYITLLFTMMGHPHSQVVTKSGKTSGQLSKEIFTKFEAVKEAVNHDHTAVVLRSVLAARLMVLHAAYMTATFTAFTVIGTTEVVFTLGTELGKITLQWVQDFKKNPAAALGAAKDAGVKAIKMVPTVMNLLGQLAKKAGVKMVELCESLKQFFHDKVMPVLETFGQGVKNNVEDWMPYIERATKVERNLFNADSHLQEMYGEEDH